jgi:TonB family protein
LVVLKDGTPTEATILHSSGDAQFDTRALEVAPLMRFLPGLLNRVPVAVRVQVPIQRQ